MPSKRRLKDREVKALLREFARTYPNVDLSESGKSFDEVTVDEDAIYFVDGAPLIVRTKIGLLPSLKFMRVIDLLPRIIVDMGAVAHVANGADIMRPGIKEVRSDFAKGAVVVIADEKYNKPLALGLTEVDSAEMRRISRGKVVRSIHYVGDGLWKNFDNVG